MTSSSEASSDRNQPPQAPLVIINPADLQGKKPEERPWWSEGISARRNVTLCGGNGGVGKSQLCEQAQAACAIKQQWIGLPVLGCRSLGIYCEDDENELHLRLEAIADHYKVTKAQLEPMRYASRVGADTFMARLDTFSGMLQATEMLNWIYEAAERLKAQLIILDTASDVYDADENIRRHVRRFINMLRKIAIDLDATVWLTAHPSRAGLNDGTGLSGSTGWHNGVRSRWYMTEDDQNANGRIFKPMKSNYGPKGNQISLVWSEGVFVPMPVLTGFQKSAQENNDATRVLEDIARLAALGVTFSASAQAANFVVTVLKNNRNSNCRDLTVDRVEVAFWKLVADGRLIIRPEGRSKQAVIVP